MTSDRRLSRRILQEARPYRSRLAALFAMGLLETPALLLIPIPVKIAVDSVIGDRPVPGVLDALLPNALTATGFRVLVLAAVLQVLVVILMHSQQIGVALLRKQIGEGITLRFRAKLFAHLQRLSLSFHDTRGTADSIYRIQYDAPSIQAYIVEGVMPVVAAGVSLASLIAVTGFINWRLALVALAVSPLLFLLSRMYKVRLRAQHRETKQLESAALQVVQEVLTGLRVVKAFGRENQESERFADRATEGMRARVRLVLAESLLDMLVSVTTAAGTAIVLFIGVRSVQTGAITLGELLMVLAYLAQLYTPLKTMAKKIVSAQAALAGAERAFDVLDRFPDVEEAIDPVRIDRASGAIEIQEVTFSYAGGSPVLRDVTLGIPAGARLGVAGPTGAGKTTLASLLMRFYDPGLGSIRLDGVDLRSYAVEDLRRQFALVLQDPMLFSASVRENIAYGRPDATEEQIVAAAEMAAAHGFIEALPNGYETLVGERGMRLSGGERQRIAMARAFLRDAPILILDEPTSSLDTGTEATVVEALDRLMKGRTTLLISHRPSTLDHCDSWIEIRNGSVTPRSGPGEPAGTAAVRHRRAAGKPAGAFVRDALVHPDHEAVAAWRLANPRSELPAFVDTLVRPRGKRPKSRIYRLGGIGPGGEAVIAKREAPEIIRLERFIYSEVLPSLGLAGIRCHLALENDTESWIFLEDSGGNAFSESDPVHRSLAASWLGAMHIASSERPDLAAHLPSHGPARYLEHLRRARRTIGDNVGNPVLTRGDVEVLNAVVAHCDELEASWSELSEFCDVAPQCLVHGDLAAKNARVRTGIGTPALVLIDWETAGWGTPAPDIARLDPVPYKVATSARWSHLDLNDVLELARIGTIFRSLAAADWDARMLRFPWVEETMINMRVYEGWIAMAREGAPYRFDASAI